VDDPEDLVALAASIRQSLIDYRNDITAAAQFASMGNKFRKFVEESLCADFTPTGPRMVVNSTRRYDVGIPCSIATFSQLIRLCEAGLIGRLLISVTPGEHVSITQTPRSLVSSR
jgi:hypothetical protein